MTHTVRSCASAASPGRRLRTPDRAGSIPARGRLDQRRSDAATPVRSPDGNAPKEIDGAPDNHYEQADDRCHEDADGRGRVRVTHRVPATPYRPRCRESGAPVDVLGNARRRPSGSMGRSRGDVVLTCLSERGSVTAAERSPRNCCGQSALTKSSRRLLVWSQR
jgi:hypothetical protein